MPDVVNSTTNQHPIQLRLFPAQFKLLRKIAKREGCSIQELIRLAVAQYVLAETAKKAASLNPEPREISSSTRLWSGAPESDAPHSKNATK